MFGHRAPPASSWEPLVRRSRFRSGVPINRMVRAGEALHPATVLTGRQVSADCAALASSATQPHPTTASADAVAWTG
jgi:hypothetical protein